MEKRCSYKILWLPLKDYEHSLNLSVWNVYGRGSAFDQTPRHITSENIYKSLPTVTVIAGPNPVRRRSGWCASKTHKPTHIPERVSQPCLHKTIMSEIFLCSLNTWSLQFGEMAAWLSVLEACPDTVLSSRLPTVSAHTLQLWEATVLHSRAWVGTGVLTGSSPLPPPPPPLSLCPILHHELSFSCEGSKVASLRSAKQRE